MIFIPVRSIKFPQRVYICDFLQEKKVFHKTLIQKSQVQNVPNFWRQRLAKCLFHFTFYGRLLEGRRGKFSYHLLYLSQQLWSVFNFKSKMSSSVESQKKRLSLLQYLRRSAGKRHVFQDVDVKFQVHLYLKFDVDVLEYAFLPRIVTFSLIYHCQSETH